MRTRGRFAELPSRATGAGRGQEDTAIVASRANVCEICRSTAAKPVRCRVTVVPNTEYDLVECLDCGVMYVQPLPTDEALAAFYSAEYFDFERNKYEGRGRAFARRYLKGRPRARFLDLGCATGFFLNGVGRESGWEVFEHRARAENALQQVQKLEALGRLTGGVAHDFNNLLMIVSNNLHLLRRLEPSLEGSRQLAAIGRAVLSGERLTRQLLAFARRQPLHPEVLSLQERLPMLLALVAPTLGPRIEGQCTVDPDTPSVEVDAAELELAIITLAVNAKDAMPNGGRFHLSARRARPQEADVHGDFVVISVADTSAS